MGERLSCFEANRMSTLYEPADASKSYTESEITEFVGNAKDFKSPDKSNIITKVEKVTSTEHINLDKLIESKPQYSFAQSPMRTLESRRINVNRIYSSNASRNSTNLTDKVNNIHKSPFRCPEKMPSFRSYSPFLKTSQESES